MIIAEIMLFIALVRGLMNCNRIRECASAFLCACLRVCIRLFVCLLLCLCPCLRVSCASCACSHACVHVCGVRIVCVILHADGFGTILHRRLFISAFYVELSVLPPLAVKVNRPHETASSLIIPWVSQSKILSSFPPQELHDHAFLAKKL